MIINRGLVYLPYPTAVMAVSVGLPGLQDENPEDQPGRELVSPITMTGRTSDGLSLRSKR
jgi:hypothetical protein